VSVMHSSWGVSLDEITKAVLEIVHVTFPENTSIMVCYLIYLSLCKYMDILRYQRVGL